MKPAYFLLVAAGLSSSCGSKARSRPYVESYRLSITPHARLLAAPRQSTEGVLPFTYYAYHLAPGSGQVVEIQYVHGDRMRSDATAVETLVFELADTATAFHLQGRAFAQHNTLYERRCLCVEPEANKPRRVPESGNVISGQRLTPTRWRIQCAVGTIDFTDTLQVAPNGSKVLANGSGTLL